MKQFLVHWVPPPIAAKAIPLPTCLLVNASGEGLWMDQSETWLRRFEPQFILAALCEHLD